MTMIVTRERRPSAAQQAASAAAMPERTASAAATLRDEAHSAFRRETASKAIRCLLDDLPDDVRVTLKGRPLPRLAPDMRGFRVTIVFQDQSVTLDVVFLRRGRVLSELEVTAVNTPPALATALARKVAARMG